MNINSVELLSHIPINELASFYKTVLNLSIIESLENSISFRAGSSVLTFKTSTNNIPPYHFAFNVLPSDWDEIVSTMKDKIDLLTYNNSNIIYFDDWNAQSIYFIDSAGNIVELIARNDLAITNKPENSNYIISISEIAIACEDFESTKQLLIDNYKLTHYSKQKQLSNFAALGDEEGLLILATKGRKWFPTDINADVAKVKININNNSEITF